MTTGLMADDFYRDHLVGRNHPECPERYDGVMRALTRQGLMDRLVRIPSRDATLDDLVLCHTPVYLRIARQDRTSSGG